MSASRSSPFRHHLLAILLMAVVGFAVNAWVANEFDERHAYQNWETMFNSDPNWYLLKLTDGTYSSRRHPLFHVFVSFPARTLAAAASRVTGADEQVLRRQLIIMAAPVMSGAKTAVLVAFCLALGLSLRFAILIAAIDIASLSRLIFGSIPESFSATALATMWMFYFAVRAMRDRDLPLRWGAWFACGLFALGVTVTNVIPFGILLFIVMISRASSWHTALWRSVGMTVSVIVAGAALHLASQPFVNPDPPLRVASRSLASAPIERAQGEPDVLRNITPFVQFAPLMTLGQIPGGTTATFLAPPAANHPRVAKPGPGPSTRTTLALALRQFTVEWIVCMAIVFAVVGVAVHAAWRAPVTLRPVALGVAAVLLFNLALFTLWGFGSPFMYTLHWQPCLVVLLALGGMAQTNVARRVVIANAALLVMELIWNARFLNSAWSGL